MHVRLISSAVAVSLLVSACTSADVGSGPEGPWIGTTSAADGVRTVITESGSVWGGVATVVEEAAIGADAGADEIVFGEVASVYANDGTIYVIDSAAPAVRMFDLDGNFLGNLGAAGEGPGEFTRPFRLAVAADGRAFLSEPAASRIHVYSADGAASATWEAATSGAAASALVFGEDGVLWVTVGGAAGGAAGRPGIQALPEGQPGERVVIEQLDGEPVPADGAGIVWTPAGAGQFIVGRSGATAYRFEVQRGGGPELVIERAWQPTSINPEFGAWFLRVYGRERPPTLPPYVGFIQAASGEIWVTRPANARRVPGCHEDLSDLDAARENPCWVPAFRVDVFGADGRLLGKVDLPDEVIPFSQWMHIDGDTLIARALADDGGHRVKRFRIVLPEPGQEPE